MPRTLMILCASSALCALGLTSAVGQEAKPKSKTTTKTTVPGGTAGHIKSVDVEKKTLTIVTDDGAEHTYSIDDKTTMAGPRGGKVPRGLRDPRFRQEGMGLIVVPDGTKAKEIHLGTRPRSATAKAKAKSKAKATDKGAAPSSSTETTAPTEASAPAENSNNNVVTGKVKSYNSERHILGVLLSNGQTRSYMLSKEVKVLVRGKTSSTGVNDPAIKVDAAVEVVVHPGSVRKVDEVRIDHPAENAQPKAKAKSKRAA